VAVDRTRNDAPFNIAVTGLGALIGQGIARSLRLGGRAVVHGVDRKASALARDLCDTFRTKPKGDEGSQAYLAFWVDFVTRNRIDLIVPGISVDMYFLDAHRQVFADLGVKLALNTPDLIAVTRDKLAFDAAFAAVGLPRIPTAVPQDWAEAVQVLGPPPLLLKPKVGEGSAGIVRLQDRTDFDYWTLKSGENWLLQQIVGTEDEEYTIGTFGFGDGTALEPIIFRRLLSRAGNTGEAEVVDNPILAQATAGIIAHFRPVGPTNLQFRMAGDTPYLLEINPRFSSSCSLRTAFGYNEADMCIDHYLLGIRPGQPVIRRGSGQRYNADYIAYADDHL
jgi:carbamoyl-phosphate synthase large subunit